MSWVEVENWNTGKCLCPSMDGQPHYYMDCYEIWRPRSGYVPCGELLPALETDFANLTPQQKDILRQENDWWRAYDGLFPVENDDRDGDT